MVTRHALGVIGLQSEIAKLAFYTALAVPGTSRVEHSHLFFNLPLFLEQGLAYPRLSLTSLCSF